MPFKLKKTEPHIFTKDSNKEYHISECKKFNVKSPRCNTLISPFKCHSPSKQFQFTTEDLTYPTDCSHIHLNDEVFTEMNNFKVTNDKHEYFDDRLNKKNAEY